MRDHDGVVVNVNHPGWRLRRGAQRDLVNVVRGRQAGPDVEQLANTGLADEIADNPAENGLLRLHADLDAGKPGDDLIADRAVGGEVILPAEQVIVDPCDIGPRRVEGGIGYLVGGHERILAMVTRRSFGCYQGKLRQGRVIGLAAGTRVL